MTAIPNVESTRQSMKLPISMEGLLTIVGAALLLATMIFVNNDMRYQLETKIESVRTELNVKIDDVRAELKADISGVRTELKADIAGVRTELKAEIDSLRTDLGDVQTALEADIQRLDDRLFAVIVPQPAGNESDSNPDNQ